MKLGKLEIYRHQLVICVLEQGFVLHSLLFSYNYYCKLILVVGVVVASTSVRILLLRIFIDGVGHEAEVYVISNLLKELKVYGKVQSKKGVNFKMENFLLTELLHLVLVKIG